MSHQVVVAQDASGNDADDHQAGSGILPPEHWTQLDLGPDPDPDAWERDSAIGDDAYSAASLTASVLEYRTLNGRTYHSLKDEANASYWGPNDHLQNEAMDLYHHCATLLLDGLFIAPLDRSQIRRVLDVGTGTGLWAVDFADAFPQAEVIGTDISPIQPNWIPTNLSFEIEDATVPWRQRARSFDFIHIRSLFGSIADWTALYREAFRCLRPGGYLEDFENSTDLQSDDGTVLPCSAMAQFGRVYAEGGRRLGRSFTVVQDGVQERCMAEVGFVDIVVKDYKIPVGNWHSDRKQREIGMFARSSLEDDIEGWVMYMWSRVMGWLQDDIMVYIAHLRRELRSRRVHSYFNVKVVYGRKPQASSPTP